MIDERQDIHQEVLELINKTIGGKYIGKFEVVSEEPDFWALNLYLDKELVPMVFSYQGSYEDFKCYLIKELKARQLERHGFYKIDLVTGEQNISNFESKSGPAYYEDQEPVFQYSSPISFESTPEYGGD